MHKRNIAAPFQQSSSTGGDHVTAQDNKDESTDNSNTYSEELTISCTNDRTVSNGDIVVTTNSTYSYACYRTHRFPKLERTYELKFHTVRTFHNALYRFYLLSCCMI